MCCYIPYKTNRHFIQQKLWTWWEKCEVRRVDTDSFPVAFDIGDAPIFSACIYHGHVLCILWFTFWDCFMSYSVYSLLTRRVCRMLSVVYVVSQTCYSMICYSFYCNWQERIWYSKYWTYHRDSRCSDEGLWKWLQDQLRDKPNRTKASKFEIHVPRSLTLSLLPKDWQAS